MDLGPMLREKHQHAMRWNRIKLGAMLVLLVVVVLVMFELNRWGRQALEGEGAAKEDGEVIEAGPPVNPKDIGQLPEHEQPDLGPLTPVAPPRPIALPKEDAEKKFPFLKDPKTLEEVIDQNTDLESAPLFYMLYKVFNDKQEALRAEADTKVAWTALWEKGAEWRGKAVRVSGQIMQMAEQPLPENPMALSKVYVYRVRAENAPPDSKGHLYDVYSLEKLKGALRYDRVTACGRFLKARVSEPERLTDPDLHVAVVVARQFDPLTYLDEARMPGPIVDGNRAEARPLYWLLNRARKTSFDDLKAKASTNLTYLDFVNRPELYRGRPVAVVGQLRRLIRIALPPDNILDMPDVFYGQIADRDRKINTFYCLHVPEGVRSSDGVVLYGYFLKKWTYRSEGGYEVHSPIIVAQRLRIIDESNIGTDPTYQIILVVAVAATAVIIGAALLVTRARDRRADEARRQRDLERLKAKLGHPTAPKHDAEASRPADPEPPPS
ncbi:MAG TPA: hypothetical protein PLE19_18085 [Planctomycetota bacterium]|nr:hypothetical protein [Planctomycetota bacterium]HRR80705.1 hypothetical protein [Planctomycetota bacterium]